MSDIKPGDVVCLNSGEPLMTVRYHVNADADAATGVQLGVHCCWVDENGQAQEECYSPEMLRVKR